MRTRTIITGGLLLIISFSNYLPVNAYNLHPISYNDILNEIMTEYPGSNISKDNLLDSMIDISINDKDGLWIEDRFYKVEKIDGKIRYTHLTYDEFVDAWQIYSDKMENESIQDIGEDQELLSKIND